MRTSCSSTEQGLLAAALAGSLALVALVGAGESACAKSAERDEFQVHYQAAIQLYKKEKLEEALDEFQKAYELDALPRLLFNIGQLHKKLGQIKAAVDSYELYLKTDPDLTIKQREEVQRIINELRGSDPALEPSPASLLPSKPAVAKAPVKAGRFMANFGIGFAAGLNYPQLQPALQLEAGYSILKNGNGYIIAPLQFQLSDSAKLIMIAVGFHYDLALPIRGLFIGGRASIGYAVAFSDGTTVPFATSGALVSHFGVVLPALSIKYVTAAKGRINVGIEPVSFPVIFNDSGALAYYRLLVFVGANF